MRGAQLSLSAILAVIFATFSILKGCLAVLVIEPENYKLILRIYW